MNNLLTEERITCLCPAVGWYAVYHDEEKNFAWVHPVACWASLAPSKADDDALGPVALVASGEVPGLEDVRQPSFYGLYDEHDVVMALNDLAGEGVNMSRGAMSRFGERIVTGPGQVDWFKRVRTIPGSNDE